MAWRLLAGWLVLSRPPAPTLKIPALGSEYAHGNNHLSAEMLCGTAPRYSRGQTSSSSYRNQTPNHPLNQSRKTKCQTFLVRWARIERSIEGGSGEGKYFEQHPGFSVMQLDNSREILAEKKTLACSLGSSPLFSFSIWCHRNGNSKSENLLKHQEHKRTPFTQVSFARIFFMYQEVLFFSYIEFWREQCVSLLELFLTPPLPQRIFLHFFLQWTKAIIEGDHRDSYMVSPHLLSHQRRTPKPIYQPNPHSQTLSLSKQSTELGQIHS